MLEIIGVIVDGLTKILPTLSGRRHRNELRSIGADLFMLYMELNKVLICGEEIVRRLESYVKSTADDLLAGREPRTASAGSWIHYRLVQQRLNLARVGESLLRMQRVLIVVDGDAYSRIRGILGGKESAMDTLLAVLDDALPLDGPSSDEVDILAAQSRSRDRYPDVRWAISHRVRDTSIPLDAPWDESVFERIREYLEQRDPASEMARLRAVLRDLHTTLCSRFSIDEILIEVGDRRFETEYGGDHFWGE